MAIDAFTGSGAYLKFGATELQTYYRTAAFDETVDLVDKSAGADGNKTYLSALKDGTYTQDIVMPTGGTALITALAVGTSGTLLFGPEGTAAGKPKASVLAIIQSRGRPLAYNDVTTMSVTWQFNGAVTNSVWP